MTQGADAHRILALAEITRTFAEGRTDPGEVLETIVDRTRRFMGGYVMLELVSNDGKWIEAVTESVEEPALRAELDTLLGSRRWPIDDGFVPSRVARTNLALLVPDLQSEHEKATRSAPIVAFIERHDIHRLLCVPLRSGRSVLGTLSVVRYGEERRPFESEDCELLQLLADHAALAIAGARRVKELQTAAARTRALVEVTRTFAETGGDYLALLRVITEQTSRLMDGLCLVGVVSSDGKAWDKLGEFTLDPALLDERTARFGKRMPFDTPTILAEAARTGKPVIVEDLQQSPWMQRLPPAIAEMAVRYNMRGMIAVPMRSRGEVLGSLSLTRFGSSPRPLDEDDLALLQILADHAAQTIVSARNIEAVQQELAEHKRTRESLERSEEKLRESAKMEAVGKLAGGVAHDFNNILTVIIGHTEFLGEELGGNEDLSESVREIRKAGDHAAQLTRQLLAFSRRQVLAPRVLDLNRAMAKIESMLRRLVGEDVTFTFRAAPDLWLCRVDPGQVEQILMNLVVNARDAMPGGGTITIGTSNATLDEAYVAEHPDASTGRHTVLTVSDTGVGMSRDVVARIFEPFFTTKPKGIGTGLGLATVYGIAKQSGGSVRVDSLLGKGTTFAICLPAVDDTEGYLPAPESGADPVHGGTEAILLVEDQDQVRKLVRAILTRAGYQVLEVSNAGEALLLCEQRETKIDLLLTDVVLPRMSGRQLATRLMQVRPDLKVLFMSGYTEDAVLRHGVLASAVQFLQKPLTPDSLLRKVREVLG